MGQRDGIGNKQNTTQTGARNNGGQDPRNNKFEGQGKNPLRRGEEGNRREEGKRELQ